MLPVRNDSILEYADDAIIDHVTFSGAVILLDALRVHDAYILANAGIAVHNGTLDDAVVTCSCRHTTLQGGFADKDKLAN